MVNVLQTIRVRAHLFLALSFESEMMHENFRVGYGCCHWSINGVGAIQARISGLTRGYRIFC